VFHRVTAEVAKEQGTPHHSILALLAGEIARMRAAGVPVADDELRGLYIPDAEADRLLGEESPDFTSEQESRVAALTAACGLSEVEEGIVRLCLAAETKPAHRTADSLRTGRCLAQAGRGVELGDAVARARAAQSAGGVRRSDAVETPPGGPVAR